MNKPQGLPVGAVKNALQRDGLDPSIMDLDPEKSVAIQLKVEINKEEELVDCGPPLKEDETYIKVRKAESLSKTLTETHV